MSQNLSWAVLVLPYPQEEPKDHHDHPIYLRQIYEIRNLNNLLHHQRVDPLLPHAQLPGHWMVSSPWSGYLHFHPTHWRYMLALPVILNDFRVTSQETFSHDADIQLITFCLDGVSSSCQFLVTHCSLIRPLNGLHQEPRWYISTK